MKDKYSHFKAKDLDMWVDDKHGASGLTFLVKKQMHSEQTEYQTIDILETVDFGNMMLIDGSIMITERDEFVYHEMITHVPVNCGCRKKKALVIGGGDGGTLRELCKHESIEEVILVEIDKRVIELSKEYFPNLASCMEHPKANIKIQDGIQFMDNQKNVFDLVITDSTDPYGPGQGLFQASYYRTVSNALTEEGILAAQTESVFYDPAAVKDIYTNLSKVFPFITMYWAPVPTYPGGGWTFCLCCKTEIDPMEIQTPLEQIAAIDLKYYNPAIHKGAFYLPKFIVDGVGESLSWTARYQ